MHRSKMYFAYGPGRNHLFVPGPTNIPKHVWQWTKIIRIIVLQQ